MSEQREWNVAIIPCGGDRTRLESFAHWHCRDGVRQQQVVLKSDLTAANARIAELEALLNGSELLKNAQTTLINEAASEIEALQSENKAQQERIKLLERLCDKSTPHSAQTFQQSKWISHDRPQASR